MSVSSTLLAALALAALLPSLAGGARAEPSGEQGLMRRGLRDGDVLSLRDIESRIVPRMQGMQYLGPEYDAAAMAYRLKFIRDGRVIYVDVDARTGRVIGESR